MDVTSLSTNNFGRQIGSQTKFSGNNEPDYNDNNNDNDNDNDDDDNDEDADYQPDAK